VRGLRAEIDEVPVAARTTQEDLLANVSDAHRETVAFTLDLPRRSSARRIAALFKQESGVRAIFERLSDEARGYLAAAAFDAGGIALNLREWDFDTVFAASQTRVAAAAELERFGLAFSFIESRRSDVAYHVPAGLRPLLRRIVLRRLAGEVSSAGARRWLLAPAHQDLRDSVALWLSMRKASIPLNQEAEIRANSVPRVRAALPALELPDRDGGIAQRRLGLALAKLRDTGCLRTRVTLTRVYKQELIAVGDLEDALVTNTSPEGAPELDFRYDGVVFAARSLSEVLAGRRVELASFGAAMQTLDSQANLLFGTTGLESARDLAVAGLLPAWLRGEVRFGMTENELTAARITDPGRPSSTQELREILPQAQDERPVTDDQQDTSGGEEPLGYELWKWSARKPTPFTPKPWNADELNDRSLTSGLDRVWASSPAR
jgi:hypothetical protein